MPSVPLGLLFSKGSIQQLIRARQAQAAAAVADLDRSSLLAEDAATGPLRDCLVERFRLESPKLDLSKVAVHPAPRTGRLGNIATISVPFDGNPGLFDFHPGWYPAHTPRGKVQRKVLHAAVPGSAAPELKSAIDIIVARMETYLAALNERTEGFNTSLPDFIAERIRAEATALHSESEALAAAGYRVIPSPPAINSRPDEAAMTSWFEDLPVDFTRGETQDVESLLRSGYPTNFDAVRLAQDAGLDPTRLNQMAPVVHLVRDMLIKARQSDRLTRLIAVVLRDPNQEAIHERLRASIAGYEGTIAAAGEDSASGDEIPA